jgi:hypothetical protein
MAAASQQSVYGRFASKAASSDGFGLPLIGVAVCPYISALIAASDKNDDHGNPQPNHKADYGSQRAISLVVSADGQSPLRNSIALETEIIVCPSDHPARGPLNGAVPVQPGPW